jgi:hypothetical protein
MNDDKSQYFDVGESPEAEPAHVIYMSPDNLREAWHEDGLHEVF